MLKEAIVAVTLAMMTAPTKKPTRIRVGKGTTFYPIEKGLNNGILGCTGQEWEDPEWPVCATRKVDFPCGAWVRIENVRNGNKSWCKVMDRGPYGKIDENGEWFNAKKPEHEGREGAYRSLIDMSSSVSEQLGSNGMIRVKVRYWKHNPYHDWLDVIHFGGEI